MPTRKPGAASITASAGAGARRRHLQDRKNPMRGFAAAILLTAFAFLTCESRAEENAGGGGYIAAQLPPGIGAHDPRIRVDPDAVPWRAVEKLQVASMNLRTWCAATLVGPSTVVTAAHCLFNRLTQRNFHPGRRISSSATTVAATPATLSALESRSETATTPADQRRRSAAMGLLSDRRACCRYERPVTVAAQLRGNPWSQWSPVAD